MDRRNSSIPSVEVVSERYHSRKTSVLHNGYGAYRCCLVKSSLSLTCCVKKREDLSLFSTSKHLNANLMLLFACGYCVNERSIWKWSSNRSSDPIFFLLIDYHGTVIFAGSHKSSYWQYIEQKTLWTFTIHIVDLTLFSNTELISPNIKFFF